MIHSLPLGRRSRGEGSGAAVDAAALSPGMGRGAPQAMQLLIYDASGFGVLQRLQRQNPGLGSWRLEAGIIRVYLPCAPRGSSAQCMVSGLRASVSEQA